MGLIITLLLGAMTYFAYKIYKHYYPTPVVTPPAAGTATTAAAPVPLTLEQKVWKGLKFLASAVIIFMIVICGLFFYFASNDGGSESSSQTVTVRDNYGVIQQNDVDITNNNTTIVQSAQRTRRVVTQTVDDGSDGTFQRKEYTIKTIRKKYVDTNGDPQPVTISKDASVTTMLR